MNDKDEYPVSPAVTLAIIGAVVFGFVLGLAADTDASFHKADKWCSDHGFDQGWYSTPYLGPDNAEIQINCVQEDWNDTYMEYYFNDKFKLINSKLDDT